MSEAEAPAPSRGRQSRAKTDTERRERRYQPGTDAEGTNFHLWVDQSKLDPDKKYRWVSNVHDRIGRLTQGDWDLVSEEEVGFPIDRSGDINPNGGRENVRMRLMCKYKDWFDDDQAAKQKRIDDQMSRAARGEEILQGKGDDSGPGLSASTAYMPNGANKL